MHEDTCVMFVNCAGRHKKALSSKVCDRPHSRIVWWDHHQTHGTPDNHPKGGSRIFRPTVGGSLWGVTRSGPFLPTGDNADCPAHYLKLGHRGSKQARLCAQFGSTANVRFWHKADIA